MELDFNDPKHLEELKKFIEVRDIMNEIIKAYEERNEKDYLAATMKLLIHK